MWYVLQGKIMSLGSTSDISDWSKNNTLAGYLTTFEV